jgi:hypothetical protein
MDLKYSTSQAFSDMIFSKSKSPFTRLAGDKIDLKRPCSHTNNRISYHPSYSSESKVLKDKDKNLEVLVLQISEENLKLKEELACMQKINKTLLESEKISNEDYTNFYQTVLVDHLQKKIDNLGEEANFYRIENKKNSLERDYLKKDKKYVLALAHKYKTLSLEKYKKNSQVKVADSGTGLKPNYSLNYEKRVLSLNDFIKSTETISEISETLSLIGKFLTQTLRAEKVSILLVSENIKDLYIKKAKNAFRHHWNDTSIIIAEGPYLSQIELNDLHIEQINAGFGSGKEMYSTISLDNEPSIYICLKNKIPAKNEFNLFTAVDFNYFNLATTCAALVLKHFKAKAREKQEIDHLLQFTELVSQLINNKNHKELANNVFTYVPKYLEFESAGVIFVDQSEEQFFMMLPSEKFTEKFSSTSIKFPISLGITGDVYKKNKPVKFDNPKSNRLFNTDIDNTTKSSNIKNCIFSSLLGINDEVVGVLQVFNKENSKNISEKDLLKTKYLQKILGMCISCTNCISEASSLTINFKQGVQKAINFIETIDANRSELYEIKNCLSLVKNNMTDFINQKKHKSMPFT